MAISLVLMFQANSAKAAAQHALTQANSAIHHHTSFFC
jgi:hypothetical protein